MQPFHSRRIQCVLLKRGHLRRLLNFQALPTTQHCIERLKRKETRGKSAVPDDLCDYRPF
jgi:hypothetical protein